MPQINSRGDIAHGLGGGQASLNNVAFSLGAVLGWRDDDTIAFVDGTDGRWIVAQYHVPTRDKQDINFPGSLRVPQPPRPFSRGPRRVTTSANQGYAGGGHVCCWLGGTSEQRGLYSTTGLRRIEAGLLGMGYDGAVIYKPLYQSNGPTIVQEIDTTEWELTPGSAASVTHWSLSRAVHLEADVRTVISHGIPPVTVDASGGIWMLSGAFAGEYWVGYYSGSRGIVLHPFASFSGFSILPKGNGWPKFREIAPNIIRVAIAVGEGEQPGQIWVRDYDVVANLVRDPWGANVWAPAPRVDIRTLNVTEVPPVNPIPQEKKMYRNFSEYYLRRWQELGVPEKMDALARQLKVTKLERGTLARLKAARSDGKNVPLMVPARLLELEERFKAIQCPALVQIVGELYHDHGKPDVGLSIKNSGNRWTLPDGRTIAVDIIAIRPTIGSAVSPGEHMNVDAMDSSGSADTTPGWNEIGLNADASRPWTTPPIPVAAPVEDPPDETHRYDGGGNDTGTCDTCGKSRFDPIHAIPASKVQHVYDGGEQDTGFCDICQLPLSATIHTQKEPEEPPVSDTKHAFVGTGKFCSECGKAKTDTIHQLDPPASGTINLAATNALLEKILASNQAQERKLDELRTAVVKATKDLTAELIKLIAGGLFKGGKK